LRTLADSGSRRLRIAILLVIGIGIPAAVLYFLADVDDLVRDIANATEDQDLDREVFAVSARGLQLVFISTLTLLPALLFFLFDRQHLGTLRQDFIRHIIRFDRDVKSKRDVVAKYGPRMAEAYGTDGTASRFVPASQSPLLLATLVIGLGWTLTLLHAESNAQPSTSTGLITLFEPHRSAVTFGFIGAYFFALNAVFRGYVRKDLLPKTYTHITVRILLTIMLAWVLDLVAQGADVALALAFLAGIVPDTAIKVIEDYVQRFLSGNSDLRSLTDRHPLTNLDEIDIYDRGRLLDEGVNNVEALAHHDVIDLMLQTRIPVPRLVDWLDQAILYLHVGGYGGAGNDDRRAALDALGQYGIRTATDLEGAFAAANGRDAESENGSGPAALEKLLHGPEGTPPRVRVILDVIEDEEWMRNLRDWREFATEEPEIVEVLAASKSPDSTPGSPG
jgi:hypothetical protein